MKKHLCPYIDSQSRCTHIHNGLKGKHGKCIFNNAIKCQMYIDWINGIKSLRLPKKELEQDIRKGLEMYKQRWDK